MELELITSVSTTVDDVEGWDWHDELISALASQLSQVVVEWEASSISTSTGSCERNSENGVGTNLLLAPAPLVLGTIDLLDHLLVDGNLLGDVHTLESWGKDVVDIGNGLKATLSEESLWVLISELQSLINTSGGTGWDSSGEHLSVGGHNISLNGWVTTGVDDLTSTDARDGGEGAGLGLGEDSAGRVGEHL